MRLCLEIYPKVSVCKSLQFGLKKSHKFDTLIDDAKEIPMNALFSPIMPIGVHIRLLLTHIIDNYAASYPLITLITYILAVSSR